MLVANIVAAIFVLMMIVGLFFLVGREFFYTELTKKETLEIPTIRDHESPNDTWSGRR